MIICCFFILLSLLTWVVLSLYFQKPYEQKPNIRKGRLCQIFGSGGHTAEMLYKLQRFDFSPYDKQDFYYQDFDNLTIQKTYNFIEINNVQIDKDKIRFIPLPTSRANKQGIFKSQYVVIYSIGKTFFIYLSMNTSYQAIISNGPAIALSVYTSAYLKSVNFSQNLLKIDANFPKKTSFYFH